MATEYADPLFVTSKIAPLPLYTDSVLPVNVPPLNATGTDDSSLPSSLTSVIPPLPSMDTTLR